MKTIRYLLNVIIVMLIVEAHLCAKNVIHIGVLAHKQFESTYTMWNPTIEYLNEKIPQYTFVAVPLKFEQFPAYIQERKIDFVITNSAYYVDLENRYGISRIATLKNMDLHGRAQTEFGGVIFSRADNSTIQTVNDLYGKRFGGVDDISFGGWIMALRELKAKGVDTGDMEVTFYGTHEAVVYAVLSGKADAGTVRSDTLERMEQEGKIKMSDFSIINAKNYPNFDYRVSTRLYPEWPIATCKHTSSDLAEKVAVALISMPSDSAAAKASKALGWTIPLDYQGIHECLKELELGPYKYLREDAFAYFIDKYWPYMGGGLLALLASIAISLYVTRTNKRLQEMRDELRALNASLEERVEEKTLDLYEKSVRLEDAYLNEKYLRSILRTVADVNQMLITTRSPEELIDKAALCLSSNESFKRAKISVVKEGKLVNGAIHGVGNETETSPIEEAVFREGKSKMVTNFNDPVMTPECRKNVEYYGIKGIYALPLKSSTFTDEVIGVLTICTGRESGFSIEEQKMIEELSGDIGFALNSFYQQDQIEGLHQERIHSYQNFIEALVNMIEQRDTYTAGHTVRVAHYAELIAKEMELPEHEIKQLIAAAKLHDIGKVVTPDSILLKPGKLNPLEYELIKEHVNAGYEVLSTIHRYKDLAEIMIYHHERYDGSGYPLGKAGGDIPLLGHIMAVADSFDAMTTNRIYKPRKGVEESLLELSSLSGKWYHPAVVNAAVKVLSSVSIDESITQVGTSALEEERLSYFFKDRLTKLYNEDYFTMTVNGRARHPKPDKVTMISLVDFHHYNKAHGWESGNRLIASFADYLLQKLPDYLIFRVWGDRFAIADYEGDVEALVRTSPLSEHAVECKINQFSPLDEELDALMRQGR